MFFILTIMLCGVEIFAPHVSGFDNWTHLQVALALLALLSITQRRRKKERSVLTVFAFWYVWIAVTDWGISISPVVASYEGVVFVVLVAWAWFRPYVHRSDAWTSNTVSLAFYSGDRFPLLSGFGAMVGMPFSSMAVCVGSKALKVDRRTGKMTVVSTDDLVRTRQYIFINTGNNINDEMRLTLKNLNGNSSTIFFLMRGRCVANMRPILKLLGPQWHPSGRRLIPSLYFNQCIEAKNAKSTQ